MNKKFLRFGLEGNISAFIMFYIATLNTAILEDSTQKVMSIILKLLVLYLNAKQSAICQTLTA